ncbi:MAG TPA: carboxypeptidase-like regulatory domain-containing protein, partial [Vicinamibacterales bacterium]
MLPGVDVVLVAEGTGLERRAVTNDAGLYTFTNVPVGDYRINATLSGFQPVARTGVRVNAGLNIRVDIQLQIGGLAETVQVQAATTLVDTGVIGRTVGAEQIADTPLSSRRATQVAQLVPGTIGGNLGGLPGGAFTFATGITSINGGRSEEFMTTVDGAPSIRVRANGGFTMGMQNADTVEEVQVLTTNYQAEHGRASAGLLRLVTKSGSQQFRGNGFWTLQDDSLNANTWTNNRAGIVKSPSNFNQYGFTLGGPIYIPGGFNSDKSKLFFYWGEEWDRIRSVENQLAIVPSAAMRNGDFSELLNPANPYYRAVRLIRDPLTGLPCTAADQRGCFAGNVIPRDRISPNGLALMNSYPLPIPGFQQGTNNWIGTPATFDDTRKDSIKIDFVPVSNHRIAVRQTWAPHVWNDPESATAFSSIWDYPGQTGAATYTGTLSSSLINEASFSWGSTKPSRFFGQRNCDYCPGGAGLVPYPTRSSIALNYPFLFPDTKLDPEKLSNLAIQSFSTLTLNQYPGYWYDFVFLWSDSVTKITGNHTFKAGVSVERSGMKDQIQLSAASAPATTNQNGSFRFTDGTRADGSGLAISNALLGLFDDYTEFGTKPLTNFIGMGYDFYGQDSWKATRNLTLEFGLRYSLWQQWRDENNAIASFQSAFYDPARAVTIDRANGSVVPGSGDPLNGVALPGDSATDEALQLFPQLANLG